MANNSLISERVKEFVCEIAAENGFSDDCEIEYGPGAEVGEGFNSKTFTVNLKKGEKKLHLFVKMLSGLSWHEHFDKMFANEIYFYTTIYPAYQEFLREHGIENGFQNAPKCYGARPDIIALENLSVDGYVSFYNKAIMNDAHIVLAMKTLAKFHAISFAFKDQKKELYNTFKEKLKPCVTNIYKTAHFDKITRAYIRKLLKSLDPIEDEDLISATTNLEQVLIDALFSVDDCSNEYSIISQGDCWNNNLLFLYGDDNRDSPKNIMLVDWQLTRHASPAIDLGYFFYPMATEATIEKYEYYMKIYHETLSNEIRQLGSDPEVLYPYLVFKNEWRQFVKYGFAMSFIIIEGLLMEKDEIPNYEDNPDVYNITSDDLGDAQNTTPPMKNEKLFEARVKTILRHFVKHDLL